MFRPLRSTAVPRGCRSISLLDNVKKILGRATPAPAPPATTTEEEVKIEKVGGSQRQGSRNKVIGFDISVPPKLMGVALSEAVGDACRQTFKDGTDEEAVRLQLAKAIRERTGHLVPDAVLNSTTTTGREGAGEEIVRYFQRLERRGASRYPILTLDESALPRNVRVVR